MTNMEFFVFQWDPMITTLPGLYVISAAVIKLLSLIFEFDVMLMCEVFWLRSINVVFFMGNTLLLLLLNRRLHLRDDNVSDVGFNYINLHFIMISILIFFQIRFFPIVFSCFLIQKFIRCRNFQTK